ncbi:uncharacterized protein C19orf47 homolog isoform X2 [Eleutherodactylus coqui]|uniref:DUF5577 domain-containing protein n=1 Tax=Eleutherodactylus coqui TaxID=57060 RepID=A0A8J6K2K5_ELECQ|nr:hypothetical protein GDO78_015592 [Eleutherodactylus coqui]KAG9472955.1 hypothetical protein GDO78_015592 [Eleutherodactylus coqui]
MASVTLATSEWINFFKEAGIPAGPAVNYAVTFVDNRIQKSMLMDLNKEIINELGITAVGDVIAILKHAKVVHRQDICKALTEVPSQMQTSMQSELRRNANSPATRMIANSLSRDSPPSTPVRRPETSTSKISVTVSNKVALKKSQAVDDAAEAPVKRRRVTAEMEGKYIINMPKGTTPRTKKILEEQAAKGTIRTSVFDRLGAESKVDTTTGVKPTGVFSRLGDALEGEKSADSDEDSSVLQYAGVLKRMSTLVSREKLTPGITIKAKATSSAAKPPITTIKRLATKPPASAPAKLTTSKITLAQRLGTVSLVNVEEEKKRRKPSAALAQRLGKQQVIAQDSKVSSSKPPLVAFKPSFTIKRTVGNARVSSSSDNSSAQMDNTGNVSVFKRLGRKSL